MLTPEAFPRSPGETASMTAFCTAGIAIEMPAPAIASGATRWECSGLFVLSVDDGGIESVTRFYDERLLSRFELPETL